MTQRHTKAPSMRRMIPAALFLSLSIQSCFVLVAADRRLATTTTRVRPAFLLHVRGGSQDKEESDKSDEVSSLLQQTEDETEDTEMGEIDDTVENTDETSVIEDDSAKTSADERQHDDDADESLTKKKSRKRNPKDEIDVPTLDAFINYDEGADALSSMAPILETTTTHVLDTLTDDTEKASDGIDTIVQDGDESAVVDDSDAKNGEKNVEETVEFPVTDLVGEDDIALEDAIPDDLTVDEAQEMSASKRLEGKQLHDDGDFKEAARTFSYAALLLEPFVEENAECAEDWSTCRLHEALCCLKADDSMTAVAACTGVLDRPSTSGAVRARALYRRAKAYSGLEKHELALQDARSAAFLGDRRGVALYGQLMRESPAATSSSSSSSFLSPGSGSGAMNDLASSSALFESLLGKSISSPQSAGNSENHLPPFNPLSLLSGMGSGSATPGSDKGGLAKSVLSSLSKKLEDEATQDTICQYLQKASGPQIQQYAGMAGMELPEGQAQKVANFLRGVTPKAIRRTVKNGKRLLYGVQLVRKTSKVIAKYRNVLIWIAVLAWTKSALLRPLPVNKRAARLAAKQALK